MLFKNKDILFCSFLIVLVSAFELFWILDFKRYSFLFYNYPKNIILIRYIVSILLRVSLIISAFCIFSYKNIFRKIIIFISLFNIFFIFFKHPVICFNNILRTTIPLNRYSLLELNIIKFSALFINYLFDIIFYTFLIYFFNKQDIKKLFNPDFALGSFCKHKVIIVQQV